jgi:pimeloyl-ACP methyl ester carboxylesterase
MSDLLSFSTVMRFAFCSLLLFPFLAAFFADAQVAPIKSAATSGTMPPSIVIGFLGGFVKRDDMVHSEVQLAAHLRKEYPSGVYVETFENRRGEQAHAAIARLLDVDHDGKLSSKEKENARIILYGHSWGGSEALALAGRLGKDGVPVLLTIQVDSVSKVRENDEIIPANVIAAANFYQPKGLVRGRRKIRAADPAHTQILGNFRFDYKAAPVNCNSYPWWDRWLVRAHTEIECDPKVWRQIESLIRSRLPAR